MKKEYIVALDQGTTSSRALLVNLHGEIEGMAQKEFTQYFPKPGWVEHDPMEILSTQKEVLHKLLQQYDIQGEQIIAIGITNQRETTVVWHRDTGEPVYPAIVWQDKRTADLCEDLKEQGYSETVKQRTGLVIDSYFSATKVRWILDNARGAKQLAQDGKLCFGTVDSWLLYNMTEEKEHLTDVTNASRTMLLNISNGAWDPELFDMFDIPMDMAPRVMPSATRFGHILIDGTRVPVTGIAGDQQAALFGQGCFDPGDVKNTYGTGCFMLMNTGSEIKHSDNGLLTTIAWGINNELTYALEGSVFIAGAAVQWLRDELRFFENAADSEALAREADGDNPVYVVPAFAGLGAPYWDMYARGAIFGLSRDTGIPHITRATLDSLAYQTRDVLEAMQKDAGTELKSMKADGGASANNYLMQFQADILNTEVIRHRSVESTALGAAFLAGFTLGIWSLEQIKKNKKVERVFTPLLSEEQRQRLYSGWLQAVARTRNRTERTAK